MGEEEKVGGVSLLLSFLLGGVIGAGIGILLAPQRGK
jgi:gas vesicle protein